MVTGMVDYVDQLLPERIGIALASQVYVSQLFAQALWGECLDKLHLVTLYCLPSRFQRLHCGKGRWVEQCFR